MRITQVERYSQRIQKIYPSNTTGRFGTIYTTLQNAQLDIKDPMLKKCLGTSDTSPD
jgi:hypothetical protein